MKATCQFSSRWWWARRPPRPQRKGNRQSRVKGRQLETGKAKCRGREPRGGVRHGPRGGSVQGVHACTRGPSFEGAPSESGSGPPSAGGLHVPPRCGREALSAPLRSTPPRLPADAAPACSCICICASPPRRAGRIGFPCRFASLRGAPCLLPRRLNTTLSHTHRIATSVWLCSRSRARPPVIGSSSL